MHTSLVAAVSRLSRLLTNLKSTKSGRIISSVTSFLASARKKRAAKREELATKKAEKSFTLLTRRLSIQNRDESLFSQATIAKEKLFHAESEADKLRQHTRGVDISMNKAEFDYSSYPLFKLGYKPYVRKGRGPNNIELYEEIKNLDDFAKFQSEYANSAIGPYSSIQKKNAGKVDCHLGKEHAHIKTLI